ncbi:rhomboid-domain-containing protein [Annulohypoxylon truncatum]|uniref:rhomboid-domain-containing protein n=1 Tax=Annulohypoxylon truncatum TaxID=327061 RepID=UPI0020084389|nr:rhomboid-domain-containing protein [Annulohypoxylon truncatum]KAI1206537.1 rhomboid-domain-containing protein [Annulohypoxylon truncatum]
MAANEYYNDSSRRYNTYEPSLASEPPSYTSQPQHQDRPNANTVSPFESVFDDHVYPTNSQSHQTPDSSLHNLDNSQQTFAYDTRYHGAAPGDVSPVGTDDIPLRHQNNKSPAGFAVDSNDHVYDTTDQEAGHRGASKRNLLRFGELGMLGSEKRRIPVMVYLFSLIQVAVFIAELVKAAQLTGSPIQTQPSFNPMIGPSQQVLINMGSRFVPCMKNVDGVQNYPSPGFGWPCPNTTTSDPNDGSNQCTLSELCGFAGVPNPEWDSVNGLNQTPAPNQWFRFITPIFMHAGIIHIGFNLLLQLTMGKEIERAIGSIRFFLVYMSAGIFGFVMGGNYAASGISSTGASGSLFGVIALTLLDLLYSWGERRNPGRELLFIVIEILVSFALGLLPGLDNFSHIGGFIVGICLGISVLHSPNALRRKIGEDHFGGPSYSTVGGGGITSVAFPAFYRNPVGFFKGRKPLWWAWWLVRAAFLILVIVVFIVLLKNFYSNQNNCSWCKYLSCLPVNNWCDIGNLTISTSSTTQKRGVDIFALEQVANFYS